MEPIIVTRRIWLSGKTTEVVTVGRDILNLMGAKSGDHLQVSFKPIKKIPKDNGEEKENERKSTTGENLQSGSNQSNDLEQ